MPPAQSNPWDCHVKGSCWIPEPNTKAMRNLWEAESDSVNMEEKWIHIA